MRHPEESEDFEREKEIPRISVLNEKPGFTESFVYAEEGQGAPEDMEVRGVRTIEEFFRPQLD